NRDFTSTRLVSRKKGDWLYGRIEISAKLPTGKGTWPALWMLPTDWAYGDWPNSGEIDIMEHVGYDQNRVHFSVHTESYNHMINTQRTATKMIEAASTEFHKYRVDWTPYAVFLTINRCSNSSTRGRVPPHGLSTNAFIS